MRLGRNERWGAVWLIIITLLICGAGLWLRQCRRAADIPETVTIYKTQTDTIYRSKKRAKSGKDRKSDNSVRRGKKKKGGKHTPSAPAAQPRDFLADTISTARP